ncbi:MAG: CPBP family intramembrane metalloprotease [Candidatus Hydrogenedens sp.]|nr:CPBP family intramembrane metalloprotease [Candidatus Hydrogenedens sp.]
MSTFFLLLWLVHTLISGYKHMRGYPLRLIPDTLLQGVVLLCALWWAWNQQLLTRHLWSPFDMSLGILLGHGLFFVSLLLTHCHLGDAFRIFISLREIADFAGRVPTFCIRMLGLCFVEELVYRVTGQSILIQLLPYEWMAIVLTALGFSLMHGHFFRSGWGSALEFFFFSLIIGALYAYTLSVALVVFVHFIRNLESSYLDYYAMLQEGKDPEEASASLEGPQMSAALEVP